VGSWSYTLRYDTVIDLPYPSYIPTCLLSGIDVMKLCLLNACPRPLFQVFVNDFVSFMTYLCCIGIVHIEGFTFLI
jgi:hypothetical protein